MTWITTLRIIAIVSLLLLYAIKFYLTVTTKIPLTPEFKKLRVLRTASFWMSIYVLFLAILFTFSLLQIGTMQQRQIASAVGAIIPLVAVLTHLYLEKKIDESAVIRDKYYGS